MEPDVVPSLFVALQEDAVEYILVGALALDVHWEVLKKKFGLGEE